MGWFVFIIMSKRAIEEVEGVLEELIRVVDPKKTKAFTYLPTDFFSLDLPTQKFILLNFGIEPSDIVKFCVAAKVDLRPDVQDFYRNLCENSGFWRSLIERDFPHFILRHGAEIEKEAMKGETLLYAFYKKRYFDLREAVTKKIFKTKNWYEIESYLKIGVDPNIIEEGKTYTQRIERPVDNLKFDIPSRSPRLIHYLVIYKMVTTERLDTLFSYGIDMTLTDGFGNTAARYEWNEDRLSYFFTRGGIDVNHKNKIGQTILMNNVLSARRNTFLLANGADVHLTDNKGMNALMHQIMKGGTREMIETLVNAGINVNASDKNPSYNTPTITYAAGFKMNLNITAFLISRGADVNATNSHGRTPIMEVVVNSHDFWKKEKGSDRYNNHMRVRIRIIALLLDAGADINAVDNYGQTALFMAIASENTLVAEFLINRGANIEYIEPEGGSLALHGVCATGNTKLFDILMEKGAKSQVNLADHQGMTPFLYACLNGRVDIAKRLFDKGADINMVSRFRMTATHLAARNWNPEIISLLVEMRTQKGYRDQMSDVDSRGNTPLIVACIVSEEETDKAVETIGKLISYGSNVNFSGSDGKTALMRASRMGHQRIVKELLRVEGVDVNIKSSSSGRAALMDACTHGDPNTIEELMYYPGIDFNLQDNQGATAVMVMAFKGITRSLSRLLNHFREKVNIDLTDKNGFTALMLAAVYGNVKAVELLLEHGANPMIKDNDGNTAEDLASENPKGLDTEEGILDLQRVISILQKKGEPMTLITRKLQDLDFDLLF